MAVVAAFKLDEHVPACVATGEANGAHGGFGAGGDEAYHVHGGDELAEQVGDFYFCFGGGAEGEALDGGFLYGGNDFRMGVAQDQGAPGADVVQVFLVIHVPHPGTLAALEEAGCAADGAEGAHGGVYAAGDMGLGTLKKFIVQGLHGCSQKVVGRHGPDSG